MEYKNVAIGTIANQPVVYSIQKIGGIQRALEIFILSRSIRSIQIRQL